MSDFLTAEEKQLFTDDFSDMVSNAQMSVSITYKVFTGKSAFSPTTRQVTGTYTSSTINAIRMPISEREIAQSGGRFQEGDMRYFIRVADIASPKKDDRLVDGTVTRYVFESTTDILRIFHAVMARNLNG